MRRMTRNPRKLRHRVRAIPKGEIMAEDFIVSRRTRLALVSDFPEIAISDYERRLKPMQHKLQLVQQAYLGTPERAVVVLEGWDTAGKGGVVRRLGWALDPRSFKVHPISEPSSREQAQHYLQRFWEKLPAQGQIVVFDRSWYGRVLVERVEQFATAPEWKRAYREINEFERTLVADGIPLVKIFLHITPDEQVRRFKDRLTTPRKRWKLSYEDFRNRERWKQYEMAIEEMMARTSTNARVGTWCRPTTSRMDASPRSASLPIDWERACPWNLVRLIPSLPRRHHAYWSCLPKRDDASRFRATRKNPLAKAWPARSRSYRQ
jgi:polyphosphate kinase 2 (PPK2 family)